MDMSWQALLQEAAATSIEKTADTLAATAADFLMGFPTSWTCATADLPCNNDFITFATKPYIRYFLKEL